MLLDVYCSLYQSDTTVGKWNGALRRLVRTLSHTFQLNVGLLRGAYSGQISQPSQLVTTVSASRRRSIPEWVVLFR